jgi:hypothetical protein
MDSDNVADGVCFARLVGCGGVMEITVPAAIRRALEIQDKDALHVTFKKLGFTKAGQNGKAIEIKG